MKKLLVFGATGGTGKEVVNQAIKAGYEVTIVVRNKDLYVKDNASVKVVQGDVLQPLTFGNAMKGIDAVISCVGNRKREPTTVYSEGAQNILKAMNRAGVNRLVCLSAAAVEVPPNASFMMTFIIKNILQRLFKHSYADMLLMENILRHSTLDWTYIRPPRLLNSKRTGKYRTKINLPLFKPSSLSRADLADYIIQHIDDKKIYRSKVEISY